MLHNLTTSDFGKDGAAVLLAAAPFAFLSAIPAAVWLSLISILVTAYFRYQDIRLRREELRRRDQRDEELTQLLRASTRELEGAQGREGGGRG